VNSGIFLSTIVLVSFLYTNLTFAQSGPFNTQVSLKAKDLAGPCIQAMANVKRVFDEEESKKFAIPTAETVRGAEKHLEPKVYGNLLKAFKGGQKDLDKLMDSIAGQETTPEKLRAFLAKALNAQKDTLVDEEKIGWDAAILESFVLLVAGKGVYVEYDENNFCIHCSYRPGSDTDKAIADAAATKGRTYAGAPGGKVIDPSDNEDLAALHEFLGSATPEEYELFYRVILSYETGFVPVGLDKLSAKGQRAATYYFSIHGAESIRFLGTGSKTHSWQKDIYEVTLIAAFVRASGYIYIDGAFRPGTIKEYFDYGVKGSGLGITRKDRKALSTALSTVAAQSEPKLISDIEKIVGKQPGHDVIQGDSNYLSDKANVKDIVAKGEALNEAMFNFIAWSHANGKDIKNEIDKQQLLDIHPPRNTKVTRAPRKKPTKKAA
jgi:hypothetical protein